VFGSNSIISLIEIIAFVLFFALFCSHFLDVPMEWHGIDIDIDRVFTRSTFLRSLTLTAPSSLFSILFLRHKPLVILIQRVHLHQAVSDSHQQKQRNTKRCPRQMFRQPKTLFCS